MPNDNYIDRTYMEHPLLCIQLKSEEALLYRVLYTILDIA